MGDIVRAFDHAAIHAGNRGLAIDHEATAARVDALLAQMTPAQKIHEIRGLQGESIDGLFHAGGDEALGIEPYRMVDGPRGARAGRATAFPVAIARAATFDADLERRVGLAIGAEVAARGGNVLLAPTINLLRHPGWGRAQETYSEDSFHTGVMGVAFISGAQNHVLTSTKHFALNNLENTRFEMSANVDLRTLHEVYLAHFRRCVVEAAAASVMSAYNKVNGVYCGEQPQLLDEILRRDWGFRGFVESDWYLGTRSTAAALKAGLDIEMPAPYRFTDEKLEQALAAGDLTEADIDRAARNALYQKVAWDLGALPRPAEDVVECPAHVALAREAAASSMVLLKNEAAALPLVDAPGVRIAVVGDLAQEVNLGDRGSSLVTPSSATTPLAGIQARADAARVDFFTDDADLGSLGAYDVTVVVAGLTYRDEGEYIPTAQLETEQHTLARGGDRLDLQLPEPQRALVRRAAAAAQRTVVVLEGGSAIQVHDWLDDVDALIMAWYPGREGGHAIADVLFGDVNPSGRMPVSVPVALRDLPDWDVTALDVEHTLLHGYRHLDHHDIAPQFPFGFGLSYTTFELGSLGVARGAEGFVLRVGLANTGNRAGATVVQVYVGMQESSVFRVPRELKQFSRVPLDPGEQVTVEFEIPDSDLCFYDAHAPGWRLEPGVYQFEIGFSSRDLPSREAWRLDEEGWSPQT